VKRFWESIACPGSQQSRLDDDPTVWLFPSPSSPVTMKVLLCVLVVLLVTSVACAASIGDRVMHTALSYKALPLTLDAALASGYALSNGSLCIAGRGVPVVPKVL